jgi:hypothetical protein
MRKNAKYGSELDLSKDTLQFETLVTVTMTILKKWLKEDEGEDCWVYDNIYKLSETEF